MGDGTGVSAHGPGNHRKRRRLPSRGGVALRAHPVPHTAESVAYSMERGGRRIVYTGDTGPSDALAAWARGCDLLVVRVLAADRDGHPRAPDARAVRRARGRGGAEASGADAFLSARRARRHRARSSAHDTRGPSRSPHDGWHFEIEEELMLVVMENHATRRADRARRRSRSRRWATQARPMPGAQRTTVGLVGNDGRVDGSRIEALAGVAEVIHVTQAVQAGVARMAAREHDRHHRARRRRSAATAIPIIAGPCSVESESRSSPPRAPVRDGRRHGAARRRVQAAQLAVLVPGTRQEGPRAARARAPGDRACRSSPKRSTKKARISSPSTPTAFRSARATCRTTRCCARSGSSASRCCSSAAWRRRSPICS